MLSLTAVLGLTSATHSPLTETDAAWHTQQSVTSDFQAGTVPGAVLTRDCELRRNFLGIPTHVDIHWAPPAGYDLDDAELYRSETGLGTILKPLAGFDLDQQTSGDSQEYTTTIQVGLLGGLLGLDALEVAIVMTNGSWVSDDVAAVETNAGLLIGLGAFCRNR